MTLNVLKSKLAKRHLKTLSCHRIFLCREVKIEKNIDVKTLEWALQIRVGRVTINTGLFRPEHELA